MGDLHDEFARSLDKPFSPRVNAPLTTIYANVKGLAEHGYTGMPRVEDALASYFVPSAAYPCGRLFMTQSCSPLRNQAGGSFCEPLDCSHGSHMERHLGLNLLGLKEKERAFLIDTPMTFSHRS